MCIHAHTHTHAQAHSCPGLTGPATASTLHPHPPDSATAAAAQQPCQRTQWNRRVTLEGRCCSVLGSPHAWNVYICIHPCSCHTILLPLPHLAIRAGTLESSSRELMSVLSSAKHKTLVGPSAYSVTYTFLAQSCASGRAMRSVLSRASLATLRPTWLSADGQWLLGAELGPAPPAVVE